MRPRGRHRRLRLRSRRSGGRRGAAGVWHRLPVGGGARPGGGALGEVWPLEGLSWVHQFFYDLSRVGELGGASGPLLAWTTG